MPISTTNPATGVVVERFEPHDDQAIEVRLARAATTFRHWRLTELAQRKAPMLRLADLLEQRADELGRTMVLEMGKPLTQAVAEARKCAWVCRHYAETAGKYLADEPVDIGDRRAFRRYLPLGPVLAVMPWNYPLWQVFRFAAPALMAGNVGLLKHASNVPRCALAIEALIAEAGFPEGAFQTLLIPGSAVEGVLRDDRVVAATLTGSEPAGAAVARVCGELIKPTLLELGGSDAFIVMPSADLHRAVEVGTSARVQNNGQSCIAAKRFIVHRAIADAFRSRLLQAFEALVVGDPMDPDTDVGPLVDVAAVDEIEAQVADALANGAHRVTGAVRLDGPGAWFQPGIIEGITPDARIYREEVFGPVALLFVVDSLDEALDLANDSDFGLGGAIFTHDVSEMEAAIDGLEAGATFVNAMTASDPRLPFGGIKRSGYGRELSAEGIRTFCNVKTVVVDDSSA